jgi:uncharacterized protein (UPF0276 family)
MTLLGLNHEPPLESLMLEAARAGLLTAFEIIPDADAYDGGGRILALRDKLELPLSMHFVGNSLGSADFSWNNDLVAFGRLIRALAPRYVSDHVTCCKAGQVNLQQNLATPRNAETVRLFVDNVRLAKRRLSHTGEFLLENICQDSAFESSTLSSSEFYLEIVEQSGVGCLLDLHNVWADEVNGGAPAEEFIAAIPPRLIREVHVAGGSWSPRRQVYFDSHDAKIPDRVFELLDLTLCHARPDLVIFERTCANEAAPSLLDAIWNDLKTLKLIVDKWAKKSSFARPRRSSVG